MLLHPQIAFQFVRLKENARNNQCIISFNNLPNYDVLKILPGALFRNCGIWDNRGVWAWNIYLPASAWDITDVINTSTPGETTAGSYPKFSLISSENCDNLNK